MTPLKDHVGVARRFQRSIRIDTDLHDAQALDGFVCPRSSAGVLATMVRHVSESGHTAFTWTGPYGTGKSSLAVALAAALNGNATRRAQSQRLIGAAVTADLWKALPPKNKGWRILPVVARRGAPAEVLGAALEGEGFVEKQANRRWTDEKVIEAFGRIAAQEPRHHGGLVVIVDEMGKLLEGAAHDGHDIFLLQQLAEAASRSERRLVFVGILHQAFDEYAQRLARDVRDEWAKVQGRFVDLVVNTAGDEQLELLSRAIETRNAPKTFPQAQAVADLVRLGRPGASRALPDVLKRCWPLHPTVACLLGPLSRRRFGQNQRSLFAFLNSAEPFGFQDFLANAGHHDLYMPDRLWDYLRVNLEPAILASPDGHRWSMGVESIERCEAIGGDALHVSVLKTIALLDLFRERSGLVANEQLLTLSVPANTPKAKVGAALKQLVGWSFIIYRKHADTFSVFAGSDFDIEEALAKTLPRESAVDLRDLRHIAGLQPILAKRHYHRAGAIRWFDLDLVPLAELAQGVADARVGNGASGRFLVAMPTQGETRPKAKRLCAELAAKAPPNIVIGLSEHAWHVTDLARELLAMNKIYTERPELRGDSVAKREVVARIGDVRGRLEQELQRMCEVAEWYRAGHQPTPCGAAELNILASQIVDDQFPQAPRISNELLNRDQPSSNAVKAQKDLLRRMVDGEGKPRFGIEGYPAEGGLCDSILIPSRLYRPDKKGVWRFDQPDPDDDPSNLAPLWEAGLQLLRSRRNTNVTLEELFALWRQPPYGVKAGLLPVLAVALFLTHRDSLALYREGVFQSGLTSMEIEQLTSDPTLVQFRWLELTGPARQILLGLADVAKQFDACGADVDLQPIDVARGLIVAHDSLSPWAKRTLRLSPAAQAVSALFRQAADPNKFLFDDIPALLGSNGGRASSSAQVKAAVERVRSGLQELVDAYPRMMRSLEDAMLAELEVPDRSDKALADLRDRAKNIVDLSGDFRLNAFVMRLTTFTGAPDEMDGVAGLAVNKPARDWVDADVDQAKIEVADLAQKFLRAETFARVQGRPNKRHAMAVIVPIHGKPTPHLSEFTVHDSDGKDVAALIERVEDALSAADDRRRNIILAALAELSAHYMHAPAHRGKAKSRVSR